MDTATIIPPLETGLIVRCGRDGTWLEFQAANGTFFALNMDIYADQKRGNIGAATVRSWCKDCQEKAFIIRSIEG